MGGKRIFKIVGTLAFLWLVLYVGIWRWGICRVYVRPGQILVLSSKFGKVNPDPENLRVVEPGVKGVQRAVRGEGRHFYNPFLYDRDASQRVLTIGPDQVGVVESKSGKALPPGEFLVAPEEAGEKKGIWREVLTPGKWRLNPRAFEVKVEKAVELLPGYVGCVTALSGKTAPDGELADPGERGVRARVLQPGLYYVNPREYKIDPVEIGYRELSFDHLTFPSRDGFTITLDVSVVWGLEPWQVPHVMMQFGNVKDVEDKVIHPQVESLCRNEGSKYQAKDFIEGETREQFQNTFTESIKKVLAAKKISTVTALIRAIEVPKEIREPIQQSKVAMEERETKLAEQETQKLINQLEGLRADIEKGVREVAAGTEKMIAQARAEGEKKVAEVQAQQMVDVAIKGKEIAKLAAERTRLLGAAEATVTQLAREADADRLRQNVEAIGGAEAYSRYTFALGLPADFKVFIRYAGPGTFWTDLPKGAKQLEDAANLKLLEEVTGGQGKNSNGRIWGRQAPSSKGDSLAGSTVFFSNCFPAPGKGDRRLFRLRRGTDTFSGGKIASGPKKVSVPLEKSVSPGRRETNPRMGRRDFISFFAGAASAGLVFWATSPPAIPPAADAPSPEREKKFVTKVIDGDTFIAEGGFSVRILGMDADERGYPCYDAARLRLEELILNREVLLERDREDEDQYKRKLRHIFGGPTGAENVSLHLVREGLAVARFSPENQRYHKEIAAAEKEAREKKAGCKWGGVPEPPPGDRPAAPAGGWSALAGEAVPACEAKNHLGKEERIVEGRVEATFRSAKGNVFLNFGGRHPNHCFTAVIFASDASKFPAGAADLYKGRTVRVKGPIKEHDGKPEIILNNPAQIEVAE